MSNPMVFTPPEVVQQMTDDLSRVADVPIELLRQVGDTLSQQTGFLDDRALAALLAKNCEDEAIQSALFNILQNLRPESVPRVLDLVAKWRETDEQIHQRLSDAALKQVQEKLPILIREYPALDRMRKAERLRVALGNELKGAVFICDIRPVFDKPLNEIEGMFPITILKMAYERQDNSNAEIEFVLSEARLKNLKEQVERAEKKLRVLKERIFEWIPAGQINIEE